MKRLTLLLITCTLLLHSANTAAAREIPKSSDEKVHRNGTITFFGLESRSLPSGSYTENGLTDYFKIDPGQIEIRLNQLFFDSFSQIVAKDNLRLVTCPEQQTETIRSKIDFVLEPNNINYEKTSDLSGCSSAEFHDVLAKSGAEFLLVIDQYDIRKEGYPYNNLAHVIKYSVYDEHQIKVFSGRYQFSAIDAVDISTISKQSKRAASKLQGKLR